MGPVKDFSPRFVFINRYVTKCCTDWMKTDSMVIQSHDNDTVSHTTLPTQETKEKQKTPSIYPGKAWIIQGCNDELSRGGGPRCPAFSRCLTNTLSSWSVTSTPRWQPFNLDFTVLQEWLSLSLSLSLSLCVTVSLSHQSLSLKLCVCCADEAVSCALHVSMKSVSKLS